MSVIDKILTVIPCPAKQNFGLRLRRSQQRHMQCVPVNIQAISECHLYPCIGVCSSSRPRSDQRSRTSLSLSTTFLVPFFDPTKRSCTPSYLPDHARLLRLTHVSFAYRARTLPWRHHTPLSLALCATTDFSCIPDKCSRQTSGLLSPSGNLQRHLYFSGCISLSQQLSRTTGSYFPPLTSLYKHVK